MNLPQNETNTDTISLHGVFLSVFDTGVLLMGPSSIGKSETALVLIDRQHQLIADDRVIFSKTSNNEICGSCPTLAQDFMEVRGLGIINVRSLFGDHAVRAQKRLDLIIHIEDALKIPEENLDRLYGMRKSYPILGSLIPQVTIPVAVGRNLAILVEVAVRHQCLIKNGYCAADDFIVRQTQTLVEKSTNKNSEITL